MNTTNFLPWRRQQRMRRLVFWGGLLAGSLLMVAALTWGIHRHLTLALRGLHSELAGVNTVQYALESRQKKRQVARGERSESRPLPQAVIWPPVLESLAEGIPAQAWLTQLRYHPPFLSLTGYAATLADLSAMTEALKQITGFTPGSVGELQQDNKGRWMFTLQLKSRG